MEVKLVIDGEEIQLEYKRTVKVSDGTSNKPGYEIWGEPQPFQDLMLGATPLLVTVYKRPGWKPSEGLVGPMAVDASGGEAGRKTQDIGSELPKKLKSFDFFLQHSTAGKGPKTELTRRAYLHTIENFQRYLGEREPTSELAKEFIASLKKTNSPSSLNVHIAALSKRGYPEDSITWAVFMSPSLLMISFTFTSPFQRFCFASWGVKKLLFIFCWIISTYWEGRDPEWRIISARANRGVIPIILAIRNMAIFLRFITFILGVCCQTQTITVIAF